MKCCQRYIAIFKLQSEAKQPLVIPPTIGRGTEVLFRFKDLKKQKVFEDRLWSMTLRREESITPQDNNSIDVKVIE